MKAYRVSAPDGAPNFRTRRPKERRPSAEARREREAPGYLDKIRKLPCCIPGCDALPPSQAHHLKCTGERGIGKKSSNRWAVPLCFECHMNGVERVRSRQEAAWFRERGILCLDLAAALYANAHSLDAMISVLNVHCEKAAEVISAAAKTCKGNLAH
jgi:hypothetical protein